MSKRMLLALAIYYQYLEITIFKYFNLIIVLISAQQIL